MEPKSYDYNFYLFTATITNIDSDDDRKIRIAARSIESALVIAKEFCGGNDWIIELKDTSHDIYVEKVEPE